MRLKALSLALVVMNQSSYNMTWRTNHTVFTNLQVLQEYIASNRKSENSELIITKTYNCDKFFITSDTKWYRRHDTRH